MCTCANDWLKNINVAHAIYLFIGIGCYLFIGIGLCESSFNDTALLNTSWEERCMCSVLVECLGGFSPYHQWSLNRCKSTPASQTATCPEAVFPVQTYPLEPLLQSAATSTVTVRTTT